MAIAVPVIMAATGVGAGAILATSLVLGATGANDKINSAASKIFGKDTVKIANLAGAMYMAYQAFGSGAGGSESLDPGAAGLETAGAAPLDGSGLTGVSSPLTAVPEAVAGATDVTGAVSATPGGGALSAATGPGARLDLLAPQAQPGASFDIQTAATSEAAQPVLGAAVAPQAPMAPAAPSGANAVSNVINRVGSTFKGMSPQAQGALVLVGGQVVGGWAQGRAQDKAAQAQRDYDAQYRSGSGLKKW